jgi:hypothetical protein
MAEAREFPPHHNIRINPEVQPNTYAMDAAVKAAGS